MQILYYINNIEVERPLNYAELSIELNYDLDDSSTNTVSLTEFEFGLGSQVEPNDSAKLIFNHLNGGLSGGVGCFEGLPFRIELTSNSTTYNLFDGYLDTSTAIYDCDRIVIQGVESGKIDFLNEVADSFTYEFLYNARPDLLNNNDFISIPYVLSELPNNREAFMAAISLFLIVETLANQLQTFSEYVAGLAVLGWSDLPKIILRIIYITGILVATYNIIKQLINLLIQPTKYHDAMRVTRLCEIGCEYLGYTFESSILYSAEFEDMIIIPNKYNHEINENDDNILGFLSSNNPIAKGYFNGTFGELLRGLKEMFNAKIVIEGNVLKFEREDYNNSAYNYEIPPVDQTAFTLNYEEFNAKYSVRFQTDLNDKNTIQNYEGVEAQVITTPKGSNNQDMVLMKGGQTRLIPFARCSRKEELTFPEQLFAVLTTTIDAIANEIVDAWNYIISIIQTIVDSLGTILTLIGLGVVGGFTLVVNLLTAAGINSILGNPINLDIDNLPTLSWTNLAESFTGREKMLTMENDFIDVQKIGIFKIRNKAKNNKVDINNFNYINAEYLYNNYHFLRTFVKSTAKPNANQYKIYEVDEVPFCFDDYVLLRNNNYLQDDEQRDGELISLRWNVEEEKATINYKINELYNDNLKNEILIPNGK